MVVNANDDDIDRIAKELDVNSDVNMGSLDVAKLYTKLTIMTKELTNAMNDLQFAKDTVEKLAIRQYDGSDDDITFSLKDLNTCKKQKLLHVLQVEDIKGRDV